MTVPTNVKLRQVAGMCDRIANFGSWPPTEAYRDRMGGQGVLLNLQDPDATGAKGATQVRGIRSHQLWAGVWHPVPPSGDDGALRAKLIDEKIRAIDTELVETRDPKVDVVWLNLEGYTIQQWLDFLWGQTPDVKGWRGAGGVRGSSGGYRPGIATGVVDEPFKDGSVKPHKDFMAARFMVAVEGFYGPTQSQPDMTPADHPQALIDRIVQDSYPPEQVVGCYDAALGSIVTPHQPLRIRGGLHFTLERARQAQII